MCDHRLWGEPDGLVCTRTDGPHVTGHVYVSTSWRPEEHAGGDY